MARPLTPAPRGGIRGDQGQGTSAAEASTRKHRHPVNMAEATISNADIRFVETPIQERSIIATVWMVGKLEPTMTFASEHSALGFALRMHLKSDWEHAARDVGIAASQAKDILPDFPEVDPGAIEEAMTRLTTQQLRAWHDVLMALSSSAQIYCCVRKTEVYP